MKLARRKILQLAAGAAASIGAPRAALSQPYPSRQVRVVVPFAPGGPTDIFARLIVQKLSEQLGKPFYIENVGGASGSIGAAELAGAPRHACTIMFSVNRFAIRPVFFEKALYDPFKDFEFVTL